MRFFLLVAFGLFSAIYSGSWAQRSKYIRCGTDNYIQQNDAAYPDNRRKRIELSQQFYQELKERAKLKTTEDSVIYRIPVVFHIIHMNGPENISNEQVESQIQVLNEDYNAIKGSRGAKGNNARIEFFLAQLDPNGNRTNGIIRYFSPHTYHDYLTQLGLQGSTEEQLKKDRFWDPSRYLNIWVVKSINGQVLGYSSLACSGFAYDGIVLNAANVGRVGVVDAPYNYGRTGTHEVGHWMGLLHPFDRDGTCEQEGLTPETCATEGDLICDTPPTYNANYECHQTKPNTCNEIPIDEPDMIENYMDYTPDSCTWTFTPLQIEKMRASLRNCRPVIISDENLRRTGYHFLTSQHLITSELGGFSVYPNPVASSNFKFWLKNQNHNLQILRVSLVNSEGKVIESFSPAIANAPEFELSTANLLRGVYAISICTKQGIAVQKVIIE